MYMYISMYKIYTYIFKPLDYTLRHNKINCLLFYEFSLRKALDNMLKFFVYIWKSSSNVPRVTNTFLCQKV